MRRTWDDLYISIAREMSTMSTCARRHVGCVLTDSRNRILSTGINGVPRDWPHCDPESATRRPFQDREGKWHWSPDPIQTCSGAKSPPGLSNREPSLDNICVANHAEANALMLCSNVDLVSSVYTTVSPCLECVKKLLCTGATRIVFLEDYPGPSRDLWLRGVATERKWVRYEA